MSWPGLVEHENGFPFIVSHGSLYRIQSSADRFSLRFERLPNLPSLGVLTALEIADQLLVGNRDGVYQKNDHSFISILTDIEVNRLFKVSPNQCLAIGRHKIAALEWNGKSWYEPAPRIAGVGFPYICSATQSAIWVELGNNKAARVTLKNGKIKTQTFEDYPWIIPAWVHVGIIDDIVVLTGDGSSNGYLLYDERKENFTKSPEIDRLIATAPTPIFRPFKDKEGTIWAAHENGIYAIDRIGGQYQFDTDSYSTIRTHIAVIQLTGQDDVWVSNGSSLFHVDRDRATVRQRETHPKLVSITDTNTNKILYSIFKTKTVPDRFPFSLNDLEFQFFSGSYASAATHAYEFKMTSRSANWTIRSTESSIALTNLREDNYQLSAQRVDQIQTRGAPLLSSFTIKPPWFRTRIAYLLYWTFFVVIVLLLVVSFTSRSKRRHAELEALVNERTDELRRTLEKLNKKERKAAILSERNRLAGEIHDSVQQGLSGIALQLEATLKLPELVDSVRSRLAVAMNMVSFTRHEVQQAIWGLESPLLENSDLASALHKMVTIISTGGPKLEFQTTGPSREIDTTTQHHLLRITQEAVTNSIKHAEAKNISVQLVFGDNTVTLVVSDDGKGFQPSDSLSSGLGHFGMRGLRGRAAKIQGTLTIESKPDGGSQISVTTNLPDSNVSKINDN